MNHIITTLVFVVSITGYWTAPAPQGPDDFEDFKEDPIGDRGRVPFGDGHRPSSAGHRPFSAGHRPFNAGHRPFNGGELGGGRVPFNDYDDRPFNGGRQPINNNFGHREPVGGFGNAGPVQPFNNGFPHRSVGQRVGQVIDGIIQAGQRLRNTGSLRSDNRST